MDGASATRYHRRRVYLIKWHNYHLLQSWSNINGTKYSLKYMWSVYYVSISIIFGWSVLMLCWKLRVITWNNKKSNLLKLIEYGGPNCHYYVWFVLSIGNLLQYHDLQQKINFLIHPMYNESSTHEKFILNKVKMTYRLRLLSKYPFVCNIVDSDVFNCWTYHWFKTIAFWFGNPKSAGFIRKSSFVSGASDVPWDGIPLSDNRGYDRQPLRHPATL